MDERMRMRGRPGVTAPIAPSAAPLNPTIAAAVAEPPRVGKEQIQEWNALLDEYKAGKQDVDRRVKEAEEWWRLRNTRQEQRNRDIAAGTPVDFHSSSGWLHNVITSKHADMMDAFPEPNVLPREPGDKGEAKILSDIIPVVLEQNKFEKTYSDVQWQRLKTGTGVYKIMWDAEKLNGLGDISVKRVNLLELFWEPNIEDIQDGRCVFHVEQAEIEDLEGRYPELKGKLRSGGTEPNRFADHRDSTRRPKANVVEVYYHRYSNGRKLLHYCKYVGDTVLYATENEPEMQERGLYDHGKYPFILDRLFPVEGSPCGYGFVDLCRNPQTEIDLMRTAFVKNTLVGATPRFFVREDGEVNEDEFTDLSKPLVHVSGNLGQDSVIPIQYSGLDGNHVSMLQETIQELRETSGNTETAVGSSTHGATAASAIAALQEASGKGSRDATQASYRAYGELVELLIELIRQFYTLPRQFRIVGQRGAEMFVSYSNQGLQAQPMAYGGLRLPVFDIKVVPERRSSYSRLSQNELALQFFGLGFFDPARATQVIPCLDMMEFDGKDELEQKVQQNGDLYQQLIMYQQLALQLAAKYQPELVQGLGGAITQGMGGGAAPAAPAAMPQPQGEPSHVQKARTAAQTAPLPGGN